MELDIIVILYYHLQTNLGIIFPLFYLFLQDIKIQKHLSEQ